MMPLYIGLSKILDEAFAWYLEAHVSRTAVTEATSRTKTDALRISIDHGRIQLPYATLPERRQDLFVWLQSWRLHRPMSRWNASQSERILILSPESKLSDV